MGFLQMTVQKISEWRGRVDGQMREKIRVWGRLSRTEGMVVIQKKKTEVKYRNNNTEVILQ